MRTLAIGDIHGCCTALTSRHWADGLPVWMRTPAAIGRRMRKETPGPQSLPRKRHNEQNELQSRHSGRRKVLSNARAVAIYGGNCDL